MGQIEVKEIIDRLLIDYEKSESLCILFYSSDKIRDFKLLNDKLTSYKQQLDCQLNGTETQPS